MDRRKRRPRRVPGPRPPQRGRGRRGQWLERSAAQSGRGPGRHGILDYGRDIASEQPVWPWRAAGFAFPFLEWSRCAVAVVAQPGILTGYRASAASRLRHSGSQRRPDLIESLNRPMAANCRIVPLLGSRATARGRRTSDAVSGASCPFSQPPWAANWSLSDNQVLLNLSTARGAANEGRDSTVWSCSQPVVS